MTTLTPPWDTDQAALNAAEILDEMARKSGRFREERNLAVWCPGCTKGKRRLVRSFVGPDDAGNVRSWILVPGYGLAGRTVPSLCAPAPSPGEAWRPLYGNCHRCRGGVVVLFPDAEGHFARMRQAATKQTIVMRFGSPTADEWAAGDETTAIHGGDRWLDGPFGSWLMIGDTPTLGTVAGDR